MPELPEPSERSRPVLWALVAAVLATIGVLGWLLAGWTLGGPWALPVFLLTLFAAGYVPGTLCLSMCKASLSPLEDVALSPLLGLNLSAAVYWVAMAVGAGWLVAVWVLLAVVAWLLRGGVAGLRRRWLLLAPNRFHLALLGVVVLSLLPLGLQPLFVHNLSPLPGGEITFYPLADVVIHASMANELTHTVPPRVPFFPESSATYHYGMDLVTAMLSALTPLGVQDLMVRFLPAFFLGTAVLAIYSFARRWLGSGWGGVLTALLTLFGDDFSYVPGLLLGSSLPWNIQFFAVPSVVSLYLLNPMLPALGLMFAAFFCLLRYARGEAGRWLLLSAVFIAMLIEYKVFTGAHVLLATGTVGLVRWIRLRDARLLAVTAAASGLALLIMLPMASGGPAVPISFRFRPGPYVVHMLANLGLGDTALTRHIATLFYGESVSPLGVVLLPLALLLYLLGAWGMRILGLPALLNRRGAFGPSDALRPCMAVLVLAGPLLSLVFEVVPTGHPPYSQYNNAIWLFVGSKYVAWVFVVECLLGGLRRSMSRWRRAGMVAGLVVLSVPSSVQYLLAWQWTGERIPVIPREEMEAIRALDKAAAPGDVVVAPESIAGHVVSLTRCRAQLLTVFPAWLMSPEEHARRLAEANQFWVTWSQGRFALDVLGRMRARYVIVDVRRLPPPPRDPESTGHFQRVFANAGLIVYRVAPPATPPAGAASPRFPAPVDPRIPGCRARPPARSSRSRPGPSSTWCRASARASTAPWTRCSSVPAASW
jgi:hypothetical protein